MSEAQPRGGQPDPWRSRTPFVLLVAGFALALAGFAVWRESRRELASAHPPATGRLSVARLDGPLQILRDRRGVPHVRARSERDAWFGLGFAHAQDRLAQLLWLRRLALGRTSERIGAAGLPADRWARTLDFAGLAERDLSRASPESRRVLNAYADGVNAWLSELRQGDTAPPLGLVDPLDEVEPWTARDSLALAKQQAWALADPVAEILVLEQVVRFLGAGPARRLFPDGVGTLPPAAVPAELRAQLPIDHRFADRLTETRRALGLAGESVGSAGWVVAGEGTRRGRPLLAADLHFPPRVPARVYEAHLRGGALEVAGATLPGIPAFWAGFNPDLAWALVHMPVVVADLFEETLYARDTSRFFDAGRWRPLTVHDEKIGVARQAEVALRVRATSRGPLLDELVPEAGRPLALRWTGALGGGIEGLLRLARARDVQGAREALRLHAEPVAAALLVDANGGGVLQLVGAVPRRAFPSGLQPVPAANPAYEWSERMALEQLPARTLGPGTPWLVAADAALSAPADGIEYLWRPGARAEQIGALLAAAAARGRPDLAQQVGLQQDAGSPPAKRIVESVLALSALEPRLGREEREVLALLREWDGVNGVESRGATAYHVLSARLLPMLLTPALGEKLAGAYLALPRVPAALLLRDALELARAGGDPKAPWTAPELVRSCLQRSLRETWLAMSARLGANREKWTWGRLHQVRFTPLWPSAWQGDSSALGPFPIGGDATTVAVSEYRGLDDRFEADVVAGYRLLVDAGNLDQALTAFAPGESEHAGHRHSTDGVERWLLGKPSLLSTSDPVIEDGPVDRLLLEPAS